MTGVHWLWMLQLALELSVFGRAAQATWRRMYPSFFAYLGLDLLASVFLFWVSLMAPHSYQVPWSILQVVLAIGRGALVVEAYGNLSEWRKWSFPLPLVLAVSAAGSLLFHAMRIHSLRWPWSSLEGVWILIGFMDVFLGLSLLGITRAHEIDADRGPQHWHARILWVYLLLQGMLYYAAAEYPASIGNALMISAALCYGAWLYCMVRLNPR
jgi:hypothetical protein